MKKVRITKLTDDIFKQIGENHPNGIFEGYVKEGELIEPLTVDQAFWVGPYWRTSTVIQINDDNTFKTKNSTYKIEYLD